MPPVIWALAACFFTFGAGEFMVPGLLLDISRDLSVPTSLATRLVSGYAVGVILGALIAPQITRRFSAKTTLIGLMSLLVVGDLLCSLAVDYSMLLGARVVAGLAQAAFFGLASSIAAEEAGQERRAAAIAVVFSGVTLANLVGVPAGAALGHAVGWRAAFWAISATGVLGIAALLLLAPPAQPRTAEPLAKEFGALARPALLLAFLSTILAEGAVVCVLTYISPILVTIAGFDQKAVAPVLILFGLGFVVGNSTGGRVADRRLMPGLTSLIAALGLVLALFTFTIHARVTAAAAVFLFGVAAFAVVPGLQLRVVNVAGAARTLAPALNIAAFNVGSAGGALLGGHILDSRLGPPAVPWIGALVAGAAVTLLACILDLRAYSTMPHAHA